MKMKKFVLSIAFLLLSLVYADAQTVYISETGKKYHAKVCSSAKTGKKGIDVKEAKKQGYTACSVCKPDAKEEEKKKTPAKKASK